MLCPHPSFVLLQMATNTDYVSLGELLEETADTEEDAEVLERIKLVAQELMPPGWTSWRVTRLSKEDIFGDKIDPQVLNKLRFALPTDELARAFYPEASYLSEKSFRDIKVKLLDWAFSRAMITSPPSICNKIRGSAAATEIFNQAVAQGRPMSRREAARALSLDRETEEHMRISRKRQGSRASSSDPKRSRLDIMEDKMESMFSSIMDKIQGLESARHTEAESFGETSEDETYVGPGLEPSTYGFACKLWAPSIT